MKLTLRKQYEVTDWYGMVSFRAEYKGVVQRGHDLNSKRYLLERLPEDRTARGCYKYAACEVRAHVKPDGQVVPYLFATHYGHTIEGLRPAAGVMDQCPWVLL